MSALTVYGRLAYYEGYLAGTEPLEKHPCKYPVGSAGFKQWVIGYGDAFEDTNHEMARRGTAARCPGDARNGRPGYTS